MKKVFKKIFYYSYIFKLLNLVFYKSLKVGSVGVCCGKLHQY